MLALLDSLLEAGFDTADQGRRALEWWLGVSYRPGPLFDIGLVTREALERIRIGIPPEQAGAEGEHENGNGSLMRILPVALAGHRSSDDELVQQAMRASSLTHRHPRSRVTCAVYVIAARLLLNGECNRRDVLHRAFRVVAASVDPAELRELELLENFPSRSGSGYVVDCFWSAWDAFATSDTYASAIKRAISYGDDTDTTGCVAGGLAGIYWGRSGIPGQWLAGMRGTEIVESIVTRLLATIRANQ